MPSYVQVKQSDGTYAYVERGSERHHSGLDIHVQKDFEGFRSVVDGSVVATRRDLAAHNQRNNVVHESEFGTARERDSFFDRKARERADVYQGTQHTHYGKRVAKERRADILDAIKRNGG